MKIKITTMQQVKESVANGIHPVAALGSAGLTFASDISKFIKFCDANANSELAQILKAVNWKRYADFLD